MRMSRTDFSIVVRPTVMALCKNIDRVHLGPLEHRHKPIGIEFGSHARNVFRGVKINVDLAELEGKLTHLVLSHFKVLVRQP